MAREPFGAPPGERKAIGARLGISFLGAGAIALLAVQLLQQAADAFHPRPMVRVALTVTVAFAGLVLERSRFLGSRRTQARARTRRVSAALREWPPRAFDRTDPWSLGVFPARAHLELDEHGLPPYVARGADPDLSHAVKEQGLTLVVGPPRAGKSRTAYEAALGVAGGNRVALPEGGEALCGLLRNGDLQLSEGDLLWLDDLERFLPALGGAELRQLTDNGYRVVATIREDAYRRLLEASGEEGERGRRLIVRARAFLLPSGLTPAERAEAERRYPGEDLNQGIGQALSADWLDLHTPAVLPPPDEGQGKQRIGRFSSDPVLGAALALTLVAAGALGLLVAREGFSVRSVGDQLDQIREDTARKGRHVALFRTAELHGFQARSHILVIRSSNDEPDELRIYDEGDDGDLVRKLAFKPVDRALRFAGLELLPADDLDGDGNRELIGNYFFTAGSSVSAVQVPFVVTFQAGRYAVSPLLAEPPELAASFRGRRLTRQDAYRTGYSLAVSNGRPLRGYGVTSFTLQPESRRLVTGVAQIEEGEPFRTHLAVSLYGIDIRGSAPVLAPSCNPLTSSTAFVREVPASPRGDYIRDLLRVAPIASQRLSGTKINEDCLQGE